MGFEQFGILSFTGSTKTEQFVDFLKGNELRGTVCKECGARFFPPRSDCSVCLSDQMDWFPIAGEGTLITFTTANFAPAGFEKDVPYTLGVAEFADGVKVFGRLDKSFAPDAVAVGMKVKVRVIDLGSDRFSYELVPAR
ncbi:MAG: Zn-ribbon domain-containing OB-fold protein [Thermodesulfobacteriota bacterium]